MRHGKRFRKGTSTPSSPLGITFGLSSFQSQPMSSSKLRGWNQNSRMEKHEVADSCRGFSINLARHHRFPNSKLGNIHCCFTIYTSCHHDVITKPSTLSDDQFPHPRCPLSTLSRPSAAHSPKRRGSHTTPHRAWRSDAERRSSVVWQAMN